MRWDSGFEGRDSGDGIRGDRSQEPGVGNRMSYDFRYGGSYTEHSILAALWGCDVFMCCEICDE
jgi:hypothetical protein